MDGIYKSLEIDEEKSLVIEGDDHSVLAYIVNSEKGEILFDGFVCSRGTIVDSSAEIKEFIDNGIAPPLLAEYENRYSVQPYITNDSILIELTDTNIKVYLDETVFTDLDLVSGTSYSKAVQKDGPYGLALTT